MAQLRRTNRTNLGPCERVRYQLDELSSEWLKERPEFNRARCTEWMLEAHVANDTLISRQGDSICDLGYLAEEAEPVRQWYAVNQAGLRWTHDRVERRVVDALDWSLFRDPIVLSYYINAGLHTLIDRAELGRAAVDVCGVWDEQDIVRPRWFATERGLIFSCSIR